MERKILYSPGFGAGWSSWNDGEVAKYMLTYQPIIDFLEAGNEFNRNECDDLYGHVLHPLLAQLERECLEKFGEKYVCMLGASDLRVAAVSGRIRINEYDGSESVEEEGEFSEWM